MSSYQLFEVFIVVFLGVMVTSYLYHVTFKPYAENTFNVYCETKEEAIDFLEDLTEPEER